LKAAIFHEFGAPDVLRYEDVPDPEPGPGEIVVAVRAVTVNRVLDVAVRRGEQTRRNAQLPLILGVDPSGVVSAVGAGVTSPKTGDKVCVLSRVPCLSCETCEAGKFDICPNPAMLGVGCWGGDADYVKVPASCAVPMPDNLSFAEACAVIRHGPTAHHLMFDRAALKSGETVLVMGASGGLGSIGIQIAKAAGATVIAGAGAAERVAAAMELGADFGVDYGACDLTEEVMRITNGAGVNVVFENVSDPATWPKALKSLGTNGRLVTAGAHGGGKVELDCDFLYHNRLTILGSAGASRQNTDDTLTAAAAGKLRVKIEKVLPLSEAAEAHRIMEAGVPAGKIVLDPTLG
jgi:NADPH:quinone reductase-like Zn-dependent oxidoreductase